MAKTKMQIETERNSVIAAHHAAKGKFQRKANFMVQVWVAHRRKWKCYAWADDKDGAESAYVMADDKGYSTARIVAI